MRLKSLVGLVCCAAAFGLAPAAEAQAPIPTTISLQTIYGASDNVLYAFGDLTTPNPKCLANRTVKIFYTNSNGTKLVDTDRTSNGGIWAGRGNIPLTSKARFTVTRKTFGRKGHRRTCASDSVSTSVSG